MTVQAAGMADRSGALGRRLSEDRIRADLD